MHYYPFNIGDYASDTKGLSLLEDLAYRRLMDEYYLSEHPLNTCSTTVARKIGMREHVADVEYVLSAFFEKDGDFYLHKRIEKEISDFKDKLDKKAKAGKASAEARKNKSLQGKKKPNSTPVQQTSTGVEHPLNSVEQNKNQEPLTNNQEPLEKNNCAPGVAPPPEDDKKPNFEQIDLEQLSGIDDKPPHSAQELQKSESNALVATTKEAPLKAAQDLSEGFDEFWAIYPIKRNKKKALSAWKCKKLHRCKSAIIEDVALRISTDANWSDKQYIPHPTTYLNGERWNDEIDTNSVDQNTNRLEQSKGNSAYDRILSGIIAEQERDAAVMAEDGADVWPQMDKRIRGNCGPSESMGSVIEGDFSRHDPKGLG